MYLEYDMPSLRRVMIWSGGRRERERRVGWESRALGKGTNRHLPRGSPKLRRGLREARYAGELVRLSGEEGERTA